MAISKAPANVATNALQAIPLSSMIGAPLKACIEAQAMAAKTTWDFIKEVGLRKDPKTGERQAVNVAFTFIQNGRVVQLNVPLLTIIPVPYITINSMDINFKASISAASSTVSENAESIAKGATGEVTAGGNVGPFHLDAKLNANFSSKKDSKATEESKYCVEYTMDVAIKACQDSMPAGLAKVLELLGNTIDVSDARGTLDVNAVTFETGDQIVATFRNKEGLYAPDDIKCTNTGTMETVNLSNDGESCVGVLDTPGNYMLEAGGQKIDLIVIERAAECIAVGADTTEEPVEENLG